MQKNVFSYIDTALRVIHVNLNMVTSEHKEDILRFITKVETSSTAKSYFLHQIMKNEFYANTKAIHVFQHEFHHYWQSLFYPFLYFMNVIEFMTIQYITAEFRMSELQEISFNSNYLTTESKVNLEYLVYPFTFVWRDSTLMIATDGKNDCNYLAESFTLNDFIEDPTSIYEYKLTTENPTGGDFSIWAKNPANNSYKKLYRFIEKIIGTENAFNILPMVVQLAFYTTEPISGFCNAFNYWYHSKELKSQTFHPDFDDYKDLKNWMKNNYPSDDLDLESEILLQNLPTVFLNDSLIDKLVNYNFTIGNNGGFYYPLSEHFRKIIFAIREYDEIESYLFSNQNLKYLIDEFEPFATHNFLLDLNGRNSTLTFGKDFQDKVLYDSQIKFESYLKEILKSTTTTLQLVSNYLDVLPHFCHHSDCQYYSLNICRKWNSIPLHYQDCGFPFWFGSFYGYRIDLEKSKYIRLTNAEIEIYDKEYFARSHKKTEFEYLVNEDDNEFVLTVSKQLIVDDIYGERVNGFVNFICKKTAQTREQLFGRLMFDFYSYNDDKRELFEIPEVRAWMKKVKSVVPDLFLLLNINTSGRKLLIFSMFIPYEKAENENGGIAVKYIEPDATNFWIDEIKKLRDITIANNYNSKNIILLITKLLNNENN